MSRNPGASDSLMRAIRRPVSAYRLLRARGAWIMFDVIGLLPLGARRIVLGPFGVLSGQVLRRYPDHPVAAPVRMAVLFHTDRDTEGVALAGSMGTGAPPLTLIRLARVALAHGAPEVADALISMVPVTVDATHNELSGLRGTIDLRMGRYASAAGHFESAASQQPDRPGWQRQAVQAHGVLALMDPAWRPDLPATQPIAPDLRHQARILHLLSNSLPHRLVGYTVRAQEVARCQQAVGLDVRMVTRAGFPGNGSGTVPAREMVHGVTYERILPNLAPRLPLDELATLTARGLADLIAELRPALLQPTTNYVNAQVALALGERFDLPVVYEVRGFLEETWRSKMASDVTRNDRYRRAKAVETACMRRATGIVTLSETMRADILGRGGIDPDLVAVVPNAVDVGRFTPGLRDEELAAGLGIHADEIVVGYISSFSSYEGICYLIEAVGQLRRQRRPIRLLLVGDGDDRATLESIAAREGLLDDRGVIFTGRVPHQEVERYYRTIDVFVVPRTNDRVSQLVTPLKPYEAMAMEKALVVSAVPALQEIVEDGVTGRTFTAEDTASLADVIDQLVSDATQRRRLGSAARSWVVANRTWEQNGRRYLAFYQRLGVA